MKQNAEMTENEIEFIKRLIAEYKPKKLVEIGVAAGGTSVAILDELENMDQDVQMYSIDLSEYYYRDKTQKTGFMIEEYKKEKVQIKTQHELILGNYAPVAIDKIGSNIDFLILDTVHNLPGEILDFLAFLPSLKNGAVVVLHDIILNHLSDSFNGYATQVLLDSVVADKITQIELDGTFPGIGAFCVNSDTRKYIEDLFCALMITWEYMPASEEIRLYREIYEKEYSKKLAYIFDKAVELNSKTVERVNCRKIGCLAEYGRIVGELQDKKVYIYGHGYYGKRIADLLGKSGINIERFVVTNKTENQNEVIEVDELKALLDKQSIVVIGVGQNLQNEIIGKLEGIGCREYATLSDDLLSII